ncbi:MAG TPA: hypothetical protein VEH57_09505 [Thermoplasmata archaeon]|nr:hypothetical protein [Thermoplasmata archaeon]
MPADGHASDEGNAYAGWIAGTLAIIAIMAVGAGLWFSFHP